MSRHGGKGGLVVQFTLTYFVWLRNQVFTIEDFPYAGMDYRGDPKTSLPLGEQWDNTG